MDPVSALANIIAIIQAADRVISLCNKLLQAVRDAPSDIRLILAEVLTLKTILKDVQHLASESKGTNALTSLIHEHGPIEGCQKAILKLQRLLPPEFVFKLRAGSRVRALLVAISWVRKDHKVKVLLDELSKHKVTISMALTTDSAFDIKDVKANTERMWADLKEVKTNAQETRVDIKDVKTNTEEMQADVKDVKTNTEEVRVDIKDVHTNTQEIRLNVKDVQVNTQETRVDIKDVQAKTQMIYATLNDLQRHSFYSWLEVVDPSPLHNKSCKASEPGTGEWLFRSPDWTSWLEDKTRCLWIHGIPGAGKTVFASQLIEAVYDRCFVHGSAYACSYYYCYFGHGQDETAPFLRWIIGQLCRKRDQIPLSLYELYRQGGQPNVRRLLFVLAEIVQTFERVFVLVDALDESLERENILRVMRELASDPKFENLRLLTTSREYFDIQDAMLEVSIPVSMQNPLVEADIRLYVQAKVNKHPRMKRWPEKCREDVIRELPSGANGMFRWAVCQLQTLQRLKPDINIINAALKNLPRTLDETYERALLSTSEEDRLLINYILRWMSTHHTIHKTSGGDRLVMSCSTSKIDVPFAPDIPSSVLLQAVQKSIAKNDGCGAESLDRYALDEEMLLELCGCLITLTTSSTRGNPSSVVEFLTVSFAHYTVLEFLESPRIRNGPAAPFALSREQLVGENAPILFLGAAEVADRWCWEWPEDPGLDFYTDFNRYCGHSSAMLLYWYPEMLLSSKPKIWLGPLMQLLEARAPDTHLGDYFWYPLSAFDYLENPIGPAISAFRRAHRLRFTSSPPDQRLEVLVRLLHLDERGCLLQTLLAAWGLKNDVLACQLELEFQFGARYLLVNAKHRNTESDSEFDAAVSRVLQFRGSILEFWAQLPGDFVLRGIYENLEFVAGCFDPSKLMLLTMAHHEHENQRQCGYCPLLRRLLQLGAKSTVPGYAVGSLQIAAARQDFEAAQLLLEAGTNANDIGDLQGDIGKPDKGATLGAFEALRGRTPPDIATSQTFVALGKLNPRKWLYDEKYAPRARPLLVPLLVQHGTSEATSSLEGIIVSENSTGGAEQCLVGC